MTKKTITINGATAKFRVSIDLPEGPMIIPISIAFKHPSELKDKVEQAILDEYIKRVRND